MKRYIILLGFISIFTLLTACSPKPPVELMDTTPVELVNTSVDIIHDKDQLGAIVGTEGDKNGQKLIPTALYYEFTIKNIGNEKIGDTATDKGLEIKIEPNDNLVALSEKIMGFNIFNPSDNNENPLGYGITLDPVLSPNQEGRYTINYHLSVSEDSPLVPLLVPSKEQLEELNDNALDATLIVLLGGKEIARFDLKKK